MASTERESRGHGDDAATPARIRDAAVDRFGRDGFGVGLRAIAADAGVTAGLVVHHFGSKDGLRRACDEQVLSVVRAEKPRTLTDRSAVTMMAQLADVEQFVPVLRYLLRSLQAGGVLAGALIDQMTADAHAVDQVTAPALELFAQGLLVDRSMLDDYLLYVPDPPTVVAAANVAR